MNTKLRRYLQKIRNITPLWVRIKVGPVLGYIVYFLRVHIGTNRSAPKVLTLDDTLDKILSENLSVIRFGDGELSAIENIDLGFQKKDSGLASRLGEVLKSDRDGLLICVPGIFGRIEHFKKRPFWFTIHHLFKHGHTWKALLSDKYVYGDAFITRPYLTYADTSRSGALFDKLFSVWKDKDVVLVEGSLSRLGVGNNLFSKARSVERILCPAENAYARFDSIKQEVTKVSKDKLILLSLGPTAKVLGYDLFELGYRVIDIGHIDMEYEMFLKGSQELKKVAYKYFNEIEERTPDACDDPTYLNQIIATIA